MTSFVRASDAGEAAAEVVDTSLAEQALVHLTMPEAMEYPYESYTTIRQAAPVLRSALGAVFLTGYDVCETLLTSDAFGYPDAAWLDAFQPDWREHPLMLHLFSTLLGLNPPEHTRQRRLVSRGFTARRVEDLRPFTERRTGELLDEMAAQGRDGSAIDIQSGVATRLPLSIIGHLIGLPESDMARFAELVQKIGVAFEIAPRPADIAAGDRAMTAIREYLAEHVAFRRAHPAEDLTSGLVAVRDGDGDRLTEDELVNTLMLLFAAGFETTAGITGNALAALESNPDQKAWLLEDPQGRIVPAVEELIRYDTSIQQTRRVAFRDVTLGGVPIAAGTPVVAFLGAANRDPERFPEPDRLRLDRRGARALSFGLGPHHCLGSALARLELQTVFTELYRRFPKIGLTGAPTRVPTLAVRRYATLPVVLDATGVTRPALTTTFRAPTATRPSGPRVCAEVRAEVEDFYADQMPLVEDRDLFAFAATFTEDCVLEQVGVVRVEGRKALIAGLGMAMSAYGKAVVRHWFTARRILPAGDDAYRVVATGITSVTGPDGSVTWEPTYTVEDLLVRRDGALKVASRTIEPDTARQQP